jgi:cytochrome c-type biogenesis protein CcmH/NrfG
MSVKKFWEACGLSIALLAMPAPGPSKAQGPRSHEEALRVRIDLEQSLKSDPGNSELWMHLGFTNHDLEDVDGAQRAFEKSAVLNPRNADALYMLGLIYEKKKMTSEALKSWKAFLDISQDPWKRDVAVKHIHHLNLGQ